MFERRQRAVQALGFTQVTRSLKSNESLPALPGLADQLMACQLELARRQKSDFIEAGDEIAIDEDDDLID